MNLNLFYIVEHIVFHLVTPKATMGTYSEKNGFLVLDRGTARSPRAEVRVRKQLRTETLETGWHISIRYFTCVE